MFRRAHHRLARRRPAGARRGWFAMTRKRWRAVLLVTAGLLVGYIIGPPVVHAATSLVTIQGAGSTNKAKVTKQGRLLVANQGKYFGDGSLFTFALTEPDGET